ncbi:MAG: exonuclease subunit SbcD [Saprospiraceae bacterium]|nr:exonuclease subunit SbcD [Saprospiraceae bacterium]
MKILHTSDWHIGKLLYKYELYEDIKYFFEWLTGFIIQEKIDVLLVSGDVFDLANPSTKDLKLYYDVLKKLVQTNVKVIITGGNHDGISLLNAPAEILAVLDIKIVGGMPENIFDQIIPIFNKNNELECVILAVPFLRDKDLRQSTEANLLTSKSEIIQSSIQNIYSRLVDKSFELYGKETPIIAMGHLLMYGSLTSDSEREIHIGNLDGLPVNLLSDSVQYYALGHIHKPQKVGNNKFIRYCGSPVYLDFSERQLEKQVIVLEIENQTISDPSVVKIPKNRELIRFSGNLKNIVECLENYKPDFALASLIELDILEDQFDPVFIVSAEELPTKYISDSYKIIKSRISFKDNPTHKISVHDGALISDFSPVDIFEKKLASDNVESNSREMLYDAYHQILEEMYSGEKNT